MSENTETVQEKESLDQLIAEQPLFKDLESKYLQFIVDCASLKNFEPGDYLLREKEDADEFYLIRQGKVALSTFVPGRGSINIQYLGDGKVVGWSWLIRPHRWHFNALATETTDVIAIDGKRLRDECEKDHDLGYELMKRLALVVGQRLRMTRMRLK
jgi:CRP-like cAMP-binding protein